jgi:hypothetical protein
MTNPAGQNAAPTAATPADVTPTASAPATAFPSGIDAGPLSSFGIDLGSLLESPGSTEASIESFDGGISGSGGIQTGVGVEASISAPGGIPQVSGGVSGQLETDNQVGAYGGYDNIDLSTDADAGTTDLSMQSADGGVSSFGGLDLGAKFGLDFSPVDGGIPEIGIEAGAEFGTYGGGDLHGGYDQVEIHQQDGDGLLG